MLFRSIQNELLRWCEKTNRKPLVLRGARQVGKTTVINQLASHFKNYIYLNLEKESDSSFFENHLDVNELLSAIYFAHGKFQDNKTLLFIDEIQEYPKAINMLRYFYEERPEIYVIAAGSMLETLFESDLSFPVGRVEYMVLRPISFYEFVKAKAPANREDIFKTIPLPKYAIETLFKEFHEYALVGGMPEIVSHYIKEQDLVKIQPIYDSLINGYLDDVEKYAKDSKSASLYRLLIRQAFLEAGNRITFQNFGNTKLDYRQVSETLRGLEKALLISLIYPVTNAEIPFQPNHKRSPKLQVIDTGLMAHQLGIQQNILGIEDLNTVYKGIFIEHLVGQELLSGQFNALSALNFWVREKKTSMAEVDFVINYKGKIIPIEVKSGAAGKLRSLHQFMEEAPHEMAIRFYAGEIRIDDAKTSSGKEYKLLSMPYFLAFQVREYLEWFETTLDQETQNI
tara:strand:- start:31 stop:1395 length:1365 start_codon:yes stop_codon:yes gene_type:complete